MKLRRGNKSCLYFRENKKKKKINSLYKTKNKDSNTIAATEMPLKTTAAVL
jgi:hypothetical protein